MSGAESDIYYGASIGVLDNKTKKVTDSLVDENVIVNTKIKSVRLDLTVMSPHILDIRNRLDNYIVGQEKAKDLIVDSLTRILIDDPSREKPIGSFMFLGPSGVGKTEIFRALNRILFNDENIDTHSTTIDCSTMKEKHFVTGATGSPPSYVGGDKEPFFADTRIFKNYRLAEKESRVHPAIEGLDDFAIFLFDEIEKAHPNFHDLLLGIMDKGVIELQTGNTDRQKFKGINHSKLTKFKNVLIIMTSNLGAKDLSDKISGKDRVIRIVKNNSKKPVIADNFYDEAMSDNMLAEFRTRLTQEIGFDFLNKVDYYKILDMQINKHNKVFKHFDLPITLTKRLKNDFVEKALANNIGGRLFVNEFDLLIKTNFSSLLNNGEIEAKEYKYDNDIISLIFTIDNGKIEVDGSFSTDKKLEKKRKRKEFLKKSKKLMSDEVIVSLSSDSMLLTLRNNIMPTVSYLRALYLNKEGLSETFEDDIIDCELKLKSWGLTDKDFNLMKADIVVDKFNDFNTFYSDTKGIKLWNEEQFNTSFNGNLRTIEKYITHYFKDNEDAKNLVNSGAGGIEDILMPIHIFIIDILSRDLTNDEENIIRSIFHREYVKLNGKPFQEQLPAPEEKTGKSPNKSNKKDSSKIEKVDSSPVVINMHFHDKKSKNKSYKQRLKNLFGKDFKKVLLLIKKNIEYDDDITSVLVDTREQLGFDVNSKQNAAIFHAINKTIKKRKKRSKNKKD